MMGGRLGPIESSQQHSQMYCPSVIDLENPEEVAKADAERRRKARDAA